jgi:hypothetical protein
LRIDAEIAHEPLEALLVAVVLFPAGKVSDVALASQQTSPSFRGLHHGVIDACVDGEAESRNPVVGSFGVCCARAASGHAAAPPSSVMNSRRL